MLLRPWFLICFNYVYSKNVWVYLFVGKKDCIHCMCIISYSYYKNKMLWRVCKKHQKLQFIFFFFWKLQNLVGQQIKNKKLITTNKIAALANAIKICFTLRDKKCCCGLVMLVIWIQMHIYVYAIVQWRTPLYW